jgi:hypothetical protein
MSGPVLLSLSGDILAGSEVNLLMVNSGDGEAALYIDAEPDSIVFSLTVNGKLNTKDQLCAEVRTNYPKVPPGVRLPAISTRIKP